MPRKINLDLRSLNHPYFLFRGPHLQNHKKTLICRAEMKVYCRDNHEWGDECGFHENIVCSCKNCGEDKELKCQESPTKQRHH